MHDPRSGSDARNVRRTAAVLLVIMAGAALAIVALGWRAAGLNRELTRERATLSADIEELRAAAAGQRERNQALEAGGSTSIGIATVNFTLGAATRPFGCAFARARRATSTARRAQRQSSSGSSSSVSGTCQNARGLSRPRAR